MVKWFGPDLCVRGFRGIEAISGRELNLQKKLSLAMSEFHGKDLSTWIE